jgi:hypothetical protein
MKFNGYVAEVPPIGQNEKWYWQVSVVGNNTTRNGYSSTKEDAIAAVEREALVLRIKSDPLIIEWEFEL